MDTPEYLDKLFSLADEYIEDSPYSNTPVLLLSRLVEEIGEMAGLVNRFEYTGTNKQLHGEHHTGTLTKEVQDVILAALSLARYYGLERELKISIEESYKRLKS